MDKNQKNSLREKVEELIKNNSLDKSLEMCEREGFMKTGDEKRNARKVAGDISKKYGLFKRAMQNYLKSPNMKVVNKVDEIYPILYKRNMLSSKEITDNRETYIQFSHRN